MDRSYIILFIGLALVGGTLSQYDSSGDTDEHNEEYEDEFDEDSGDYPLQPTDCQKKKIAYKDKKLKYDPRCLPDGQFAAQQCNTNANVCWCVDRQGKEIANTRGNRDCDAYADEDLTFDEPQEVKPMENENFIFNHPGVLAGVIGGIVVCLLCAVLIVMFIVYRMKKKDEGSYILGRAERKNSRSVIYTKAVPRDQEFYA